MHQILFPASVRPTVTAAIAVDVVAVRVCPSVRSFQTPSKRRTGGRTVWPSARPSFRWSLTLSAWHEPVTWHNATLQVSRLTTLV